MRIRLYFDEDAMRAALVDAVSARRVDVVTAADVGMLGRSDGDQLAYAATQGRVIYTFNVADFCRLHASYMEQGLSHAGIVVAQQKRYSVGEQMRRILRLIVAKSSEEMGNSIEFLSSWG